MEEFASQNPRSMGGPQWKQLNRQRRAYLMPDFCRISLPIRNPGPDAAEWVRVNGSRTYVLHPQTVTTLGKGITHIWPYREKARLLMVRISTQVVRQKKHNTSRVIMLPSTGRDTEFAPEPNGLELRQNTKLRHQIQAVAEACGRSLGRGPDRCRRRGQAS